VEALGAEAKGGHARSMSAVAHFSCVIAERDGASSTETVSGSNRVIDTPADVFLKMPVGRYTVSDSCVVWCVSRSLCGLAFWGRPSADELLKIATIVEAYPQQMAPTFDVVVDGRQVEALDGEALSVQMAWLWRHGAALLRHANIWSIVAEGTAVARLAHAMPDLGGKFRVTTDAPAVFRTVRDDDGAALSLEIDAIAGMARGLPRETHRVRALLARRPDATIDDAAKELGLSTRSLQRSLSNQRTSFQKELVAMRFATACELLLTTDLKIAAIGTRICISERAVALLFRAKTGLSPLAWRAKQSG
jgi:AraC-like DNA-binding protein